MKRLIIVCAVLGLMGCEQDVPTIPNIFVSNTAINNSGGSNPSATPSPTSGDLPAGSRIAIFLVGVSGPTGCAKIDARSLKNGCSGFFTCTPKDANGVDLPSSVHGPIATWSVPVGAERVEVRRTDEPFNLDVTGKALGDFSLSCAVKNLVGTVDFKVVQ